MRKWGLIFVVLVVMGGAWVSPHDPQQQYRDFAGVGPQCGEPCFLMGTDGFGRDVLSRTLAGGRISLLAGLGAATLSLVLGGLLGAVAGARKGWVDEVLSRPMELLMAMPWLYVLLAARAAMPLRVGEGEVLVWMMALLGVAGAGAPFRLARQVVRGAMESDAVTAAFGLGVSRRYVLRRHLLPAAAPAMVAQWKTQVPQFVVAEVSLSFLGLGVGEPGVSWGTILSALREYPMLTGQWWMFAPAMMLTVFTLTLGCRAKADEVKA